MFDLSQLNPIGALLPVGFALTALGYGAVRRYQDKQQARRSQQQRQLIREHEAKSERIAIERQRRESVKKTASNLRPEREVWARGKGDQQLAIASVGSAATSVLARMLRQFEAASVTGYVSRPLVAEPDLNTLNKALQTMPAAFAQRCIPLTLSLLPGGLKGRTVLQAATVEDYWNADLRDRLDEWLCSLRREAKPTALLLPISPGGSARLALPIIEGFHAEFDQAEIYTVLFLDHKQLRREINLPPLLELYGDHPAVKGHIILDNQHEPQLFDDALCRLLPAMFAATFTDQLPQSPENVLPDVFLGHSVATLRVWSGKLPVTYLPAFEDELEEEYLTDLSFAQKQAIRGIRAVLAGEAPQSLRLPIGNGASYVSVIAPIRPDPDYRIVAERVLSSRIRALTADTMLTFGSIGEPLTPDAEEAGMTVAGLFPVAGGIAAVKDMLAQQHRSLPEAVERIALAPGTPQSSRNGGKSKVEAGL